MFFGHIDNLERDRKVLPPALVKGLEYLKNTDFSQMANGKYEIEGDQLFALVQEQQTSPKAERKAEAHARMIDIQFLIAGRELIGFVLPDAANEVGEDLLDEKDVIFYKTVKDESELYLTPGSYAVFFPDEVHRPCCLYGDQPQVRKVVVKIAADLV
ncbi:MAG: YhcH/YjgK/YiaL family protein [Bacillota bacterium]|jgi:YhcH/YjgK/YiaL family protein